jgi:hypothetical protein
MGFGGKGKGGEWRREQKVEKTHKPSASIKQRRKKKKRNRKERNDLRKNENKTKRLNLRGEGRI